MVFGEVPEDLSGTLIFSNHSLDRLQERIVQLQEENAKQQKLNKECRERRKLLIREKREMAKTISSECLSQRAISNSHWFSRSLTAGWFPQKQKLQTQCCVWFCLHHFVPACTRPGAILDSRMKDIHLSSFLTCFTGSAAGRFEASRGWCALLLTCTQHF